MFELLVVSEHILFSQVIKLGKSEFDETVGLWELEKVFSIWIVGLPYWILGDRQKLMRREVRF